MEITPEIKSTVLHFVLGAVFGYVSLLIGRNSALAFGALIAYGMSKLSKKLFKQNETKWWLGNGFWPFLTAWIASWTIFLNA